MLRIFNSEYFQGSYKKQNYFEGWYYKLISRDGKRSISFIPGIATHNHRQEFFIQIIESSLHVSDYANFDPEVTLFNKDRLNLKLGNNTFTLDGICIDITTKNLFVNGSIEFSNHVLFPKQGLNRSIMGPFLYVPFMECYHGVVSLSHKLKGSLIINDENVDFNGGIGYIEKDWGRSFPSEWIWIHANQFSSSDACFMLAIAKIPWLGKSFTGLISFVWFESKYYLIATYNGGKIKKLVEDKNKTRVEVYNKKYQIEAELENRPGTTLIAPRKGNMGIEIKETLRTNIDVTIRDANKIIFSGQCTSASSEVHGDVFRAL